MATRDEFERALQDALNHLYDPAYRPPEVLRAIVGCGLQPGSADLHKAIAHAIEQLKPSSHAAPFERVRRVYDVLSCRYLERLTQEQTAERLGLSPRHLRREQALAVAVLAQQLWEASASAVQPVVGPGDRLDAWSQQVRQELAVLRNGAPGSVADVGAAMMSVLELLAPLAARYDIDLQVSTIAPGLVAEIHPSALHQVLIDTITGLLKRMAAGSLVIQARAAEERIEISLAGGAWTATEEADHHLGRELLATYGGSLTLHPGERAFAVVSLPAAAQITVLVIDDNADLVHFYRRCTQGTRFRVVHSTDVVRLFEVIEAQQPDIVVLDVMLPDADGWEILAQLHNHPATRALPVIVCTVVRAEELALALGAAEFVAKPVSRQQFLEALARAQTLAAGGAPPEPVNSV